MLIYTLRRIVQAALVMMVISVIVFVGVYAIGNPVDILINPQADQNERERAIAALGLNQPLWTPPLVKIAPGRRSACYLNDVVCA